MILAETSARAVTAVAGIVGLWSGFMLGYYVRAWQLRRRYRHRHG